MYSTHTHTIFAAEKEVENCNENVFIKVICEFGSSFLGRTFIVLRILCAHLHNFVRKHSPNKRIGVSQYPLHWMMAHSLIDQWVCVVKRNFLLLCKHLTDDKNKGRLYNAIKIFAFWYMVLDMRERNKNTRCRTAYGQFTWSANVFATKTRNFIYKWNDTERNTNTETSRERERELDEREGWRRRARRQPCLEMLMLCRQ